MASFPLNYTPQASFKPCPFLREPPVAPALIQLPGIISLVQSSIMNSRPLIALLTDFGTSDAYVGTMKGVMLNICPSAQLVDVTHSIQPQNIQQAAYILLTTYRFFPPETIFLVVVDPGVGTARDPIAVLTEHGLFVAPDNGVLSYVLAENEAKEQVLLSNPHYRLSQVSTTFHGRDIFSPGAAYLANGIPIKRMGSPIRTLISLPDPKLIITADSIQAEVLHIDHFGNIITSIGSLVWQDDHTLALNPRFGLPGARPCRIDAKSASLGLGDHRFSAIRHTYGDVVPGSFTALVGSSGQLEIGMNQGNAAQFLSVRLGDPVSLFGTFDFTHWRDT